MRKLTVCVVFRLNYNIPDSSLHSLVSFETCRFIATLLCGGAARAHTFLYSIPCTVDSRHIPLDSPILAIIQFGRCLSGFHLYPLYGPSPPGSAAIQILQADASNTTSCVVDSRHSLIRPFRQSYQFGRCLSGFHLYPLYGPSPPGSAAIQILQVDASNTISCVVDSRHSLIRPFRQSYQFGRCLSGFHSVSFIWTLPAGERSIQILQVDASNTISCVVDSRHSLIRPSGNHISLEGAFLASILYPLYGPSPPGSASIQILQVYASNTIPCVVDSRHS